MAKIHKIKKKSLQKTANTAISYKNTSYWAKRNIQ